MISEKKKVIFSGGRGGSTDRVERIYEINFTAHRVFGRHRDYATGRSRKTAP